MLRVRDGRTLGCYLLIASLLLKIVGLESFSQGWLHHAGDGIAALAFVYAAAQLSGSRHGALMMAFLAGLPWWLDVMDVPPQLFDFESLFWCIAHSYLSILLARSLIGKLEIGHQEVLDTISVYLASGLAFAELHCLIQWYHPASLVATLDPQQAPLHYDMVLYFSFVTQATLGYGDVIPAHPLSRALAILQSLYGVMFTAIVIARVVAINTETRLRRAGQTNDSK